jgi:two-component system chemotaxis response regulator CheB
LTDLGCPDCPGVLAFRRLAGHLSFTCSVGHAFSGDSLVEAKEEELERALWTALETYLELVVIHRELASQARKDGTEVLAREREARAARAEEFVERLRGMIATDTMASQEGARE